MHRLVSPITLFSYTFHQSFLKHGSALIDKPTNCVINSANLVYDRVLWGNNGGHPSPSVVDSSTGGERGGELERGSFEDCSLDS